jgi:hypothetical protein
LYQGIGRWSVEGNTDEGGTFAFADLKPGHYMLRVEKTGYVAATVRAAVGEPIVVRLRRVAVVSGRVLNSDGGPLDDALVEVMAKDYTYGEVSLRSVGFARTDGQGRYRISGVPFGRYYVRASCDGHETLLYPAASGLTGALSINLLAGSDVHGIDFSLRAGPRLTLAGHLIDAETKGPASAAFLRAYPADLVVGTLADGALDKGEFQINGMRPGRYFLSFDWVGGTNSVRRTVVFPFEMGNADRADVVLTAMPRVAVSGHLKTGLEPLPRGVSVTLIPTAPAVNARVGGIGGSANVSDDGRFEITGVEAGEYRLGIHSGEPPNFFVRERIVHVDGNAPIAGADLELDFSAGAVIGRAVASDGEPIPNAMVVTQSVDPEKRADSRYRQSRRANEEGEYAVSGLIPGGYLVFVWKGDPGLIGDPDLFAQASVHADRVKIDARATAHRDAIELSNAR